MSDATPNSFSAMYRKVNQSIFGEKGVLDVVQPGLTSGTFSAMARSTARRTHPSRQCCRCRPRTRAQYLKPYTDGGYFDHISVYCHYLNNIQKLFKAGKIKAEVLTELIDWHLPKNLRASQVAAAAGRAKKKENTEA